MLILTLLAALVLLGYLWWRGLQTPSEPTVEPDVPSPLPGEHITEFFDRCGDDPRMIVRYPNQTSRTQACDALWRQKSR